jgi:DNA helicase-2/ATP-dependent DNA helicase PcrA
VEAVDGPPLVLAGAGKTCVLAIRFAHILLTRRAFPAHALAVTNKAARAMPGRVSAIPGHQRHPRAIDRSFAGQARRRRASPDAAGSAGLRQGHPRPIASATWRWMRAS